MDLFCFVFFYVILFVFFCFFFFQAEDGIRDYKVTGVQTCALPILEGAPLMLIVTYRPGYWPQSLERSRLTQVALQPLSPEDSRSVLGGFLPRERLADPVCERIVSKAEGNP